MVEEFKHTYLRLCKDHHVEPQDNVLNQLKSVKLSPRKGKATLNLSSCSLNPKTCAILGKVLATDRTFTELKLGDCMLTEDGAKGFAHGLASNVACKKLDMKGNNIRGAGAEALGRMLRHNKTLTSICFEWNSLGMVDNSFGVFCEGLGANTTLKELDLRNNQISHDGASELASALRKNTTLKALDLSWNNFGIFGGRTLLNLLQHNKTIVKLKLPGNNVPKDIMEAIDTALGHNEDRQLMANDYYQRTHMLSSELRQIKQDKMMQMSDLMSKIDTQEEEMRRSARSTGHKMGQLQAALEERKSAFNSLAAKVSMTESELRLSEQKVHDLEGVIARMKHNENEQTMRQQTEMRQIREDRTSVESKLLKEVSEANDKNIQFEARVDELERKCKVQQEQIYDFKEQLAHGQADIKMKASLFEERIQHEKQQHKDTLREMEDLKQKEVARIKQECEETEKVLKDRIHKFELQRIESEEEISRLKSKLQADKLQAEEELMTSKQRIRHEEELRQKQLDERIRVLTQSKDELQSHSNHQASIISDLQGKCSSSTLEIETQRRKIEEMSVELSGKNNEMMAEVGKVRLEVNQKVALLEAEKQAQSELRDRIDRMDKQVNDLKLKHRDELAEKDKEIDKLNERIRHLDSDLSRLRDEDLHRTNALKSALSDYVNRSPYTPRH